MSTTVFAAWFPSVLYVPHTSASEKDPHAGVELLACLVRERGHG